MNDLRIAIDCDEAAIELKELLVEYLIEKGVQVTDLNYLGTNFGKPYPDIGFHLARKVRAKEYDRGILLCGTGLGMAIAANKIQGVYAGVCHDVYSAERLCKSNNAQILTMGSRVVGFELAKIIISTWLHAEFQGGRSSSKVERMYELEKESFMRDKYKC